MKAAIARLSHLSRSAENQRRLRELALAYVDIADLLPVAFRWDEVVLDRTNQRWRELLSLAKLLLGRVCKPMPGRDVGWLIAQKAILPA